MKKKIFILLLISFLIFLGTLYFYRQKEKNIEKKYTNYLQKLSSEKELKALSKVDLDVLSGVNIQSENTGKKDDIEEKKKLIEKMVAEQLIDIDNISKLKNQTNSEIKYKKLYLKSIKKENVELAIKTIKKILNYTDEKIIWYDRLVKLYLKLGKYHQAQDYMEKLLKKEATKDRFKLYLYIRFQTLNIFDDKQIESLKKLIITLYQKNIISVSELSFYNFLLDLILNWDLKNIKLALPELIKTTTNPAQKQLLLSIQKDLKMYESKKGTSLIYFKSLVALDLLRFSYFGVAKNIAEKVYIENSDYILPVQILSYAYFYMGDYKNAIKYFQVLNDNNQIKDKKNYLFFMGISYFWLGNYENTILFLNQIDDLQTYTYALDVLRYKYLSYLELGDEDQAIKIIKQMMGYKLSYVDYYNLFKQLLFKCKNCYKDELSLIVKLVKRCYEDVDEKNRYVCWYGKANIYNKLGQKKYAVKYFKLLSKYFQDSYIFEAIGNYYYEKKDYKKAKYYYLKQLLYTSKESKRKKIQEKLKELMFKN